MASTSWPTYVPESQQPLPSKPKRATSGITFDNKLIFGQGFSHAGKTDGCAIVQLIENNILEFDGTLSLTNIGALEVKDAWLYIRYLWHNNHAEPGMHEFHMMSKDQTPESQLPWARHFVAQVLTYLEIHTTTIDLQDALRITKADLVNFTNHLIKKYKDVIKIPVITNVLNMVMTKLKVDANVAQYEQQQSQPNQANANQGTLNFQVPLRIRDTQIGNVVEDDEQQHVAVADGRMSVEIKV